MGRSRRGLGVVVVLGVVASLGLVPVGSASAAVAGDVVISEFMFDPLSGVDGDEFLELTNRTASPVDLSGWSFTKGITLVLLIDSILLGLLLVWRAARRWVAPRFA